MRLLLLIISFLISQIADSQIINASPPYRVRASGCSYLLDQYSGASAAYSLRLLDCQYAGSAIRVRRSSDNTESDIGFVNGNLDTASMKTFVGTGGTDDGFVVTWYDQSGNANNATQATASIQPKIMDNGVVIRTNSLPSLLFDVDLLSMTYSTTVTSQSTFAVFDNTSTATTYQRVVSQFTGATETGGYIPLIFEGATSVFGSFTAGDMRSKITLATNTTYVTASIHSGSSLTNYANGSSGSAYTNTLNSAMTLFLIGNKPSVGGDGSFIGNISEVIMYESDKTSSKAAIFSNINSFYTIY